MKAAKKILTLFNLALFISSLLFVSVNGLLKNNDTLLQNHIQQQFSKNHSGDGCSQLVFEKIENESETKNDCHSQALILPFFAAYLHFGLSGLPHSSAASLAEVNTNPIYLAICNFRI